MLMLNCTKFKSQTEGDGYNYDSTAIRQPFDCHSIAIDSASIRDNLLYDLPAYVAAALRPIK